MYRNSEDYSDPVAGEVMSKLMREYKQKQRQLSGILQKSSELKPKTTRKLSAFSVRKPNMLSISRHRTLISLLSKLKSKQRLVLPALQRLDIWAQTEPVM